MFGLITINICLLFPVEQPIVLENGVVEIEHREFKIPFRFTESERGKVEIVRFFVSQDRGKSWKHFDDRKPAEDWVRFSATTDGLYWYAIQTVYKDGKQFPADAKNFSAALKVYVNQERRAVKFAP